MEKAFVRSWKSSVQPRKQRKYRFNLPLHTRRKQLGCHLSKELRAKYHRRSMPLRSGDKVKVLRGVFRGTTGKIDRIDVKAAKVYVAGIELIKKDGSKAFPPIDPSNLLITDLQLGDKRREAKLAVMTTENSGKKSSKAHKA